MVARGLRMSVSEIQRQSDRAALPSRHRRRPEGVQATDAFTHCQSGKLPIARNGPKSAVLCRTKHMLSTAHDVACREYGGGGA